MFEKIKEICSVSFDNVIIESDQGKALLSAINKYNMKHFLCIRHLLKSLHYNPYSYHVKQLVECATKYEYDSAVKIISALFHKAIEKERNNQIKSDDKKVEKNLSMKGKLIKKAPVSNEQSINIVLDKVGLFYNYDENTIVVKTQNRWEEVSLQFRPLYKMPSTTNSLESYHEHLNKMTPRKNNFYAAVSI